RARGGQAGFLPRRQGPRPEPARRLKAFVAHSAAVHSPPCDNVTLFMRGGWTMRTIGMLSLAGLILTGLPPAPMAPATGAAQRDERTASREDPDARCAPFFRGFGRDEDAGYGR